MNTRIELTCIGYNQQGDGIVDYRGRHLAVANVLRGERVLIELVQRAGRREAKLIKRLTTAEARVKPPCPYYQRCGGCQLQHLSLGAQADLKQKMVSKSLKSFAKVRPIDMMKQPEGYRNKSHHSFAHSKKGNAIWGLYQSYSHRVVAIERCYIHDPIADAIVNTIGALLPQFGISPYNEDRRTGQLRHVLTRVAQGTGQVLVCLVTASEQLPKRTQFVTALLTKHPEITTLVQNINGKATSMVLGNKERILYGSGKIVDTLCGLEFIISAKSFYQVNRRQTEKLYRYALQMAAIKSTDRVLDAYCGIGTLTLLVAQRAQSVVGVEVNPVATGDATTNAAHNQIDNVSYVTADSATYLSEALMDDNQFDIVLLDPPREGCSKPLIDALIANKPKTIVYISCNPDSQARDLKQLQRAGYSVKSLKPFDMFAYTSHVECIALIQREGS